MPNFFKIKEKVSKFLKKTTLGLSSSDSFKFFSNTDSLIYSNFILVKGPLYFVLPEPCKDQRNSRFLSVVLNSDLSSPNLVFIKIGPFSGKYYYYEVLVGGNVNNVEINIDAIPETLPNPIEVQFVLKLVNQQSITENNFSLMYNELSCKKVEGEGEGNSGVRKPVGPTP